MNNLSPPLILGCRRNAAFGLVYVVKYDDGDEEAWFTNNDSLKFTHFHKYLSNVMKVRRERYE